MRYKDLYSWQLDDWNALTDAFSCNVITIHAKEFESSQNVANIFFEELHTTKDYRIFELEAPKTNYRLPMAPFYNSFLQPQPERTVSLHSFTKAAVKDITKSETIACFFDPAYYSGASLLSDQYKNILIYIEEMTEGLIPVFIFRNYSEFDAESKNLIYWMTSGRLNAYYPVLSNAKYIFLCTSNEDLSQYDDIFLLQHVDLVLKEPQRENLEEIWEHCSSKALPDPVKLDKIYELSGNKLVNIELIVRYLVHQSQIILESNEFYSFMRQIFDNRMLGLKQWKDSIADLLQIASEIGKSFDLRWLNHITAESQYELLLQKCSDEQFITYQETIGCFKNDFTWRYFYDSALLRKEEICRMLEETIHYFSPYDYYLRAFYAKQAKELSYAAELYLFEYWKRLKEGLVISHQFEKELTEICEKNGFSEYIDLLSSVSESYIEGKYNTALQSLEQAENIAVPSVRLTFLKDYLLATMYHKLEMDKNRNDCAISLMETILNNCQPIQEFAFECDCMSTLISLYANSGNINEALMLSKKLVYAYNSRANYDSHATVGMQILNRKSSAFFSAEIAAARSEESVGYFRNTLFYPQYLMALNNCSSNYFVLGQYEKSLYYINEAIEFIKKHPTVRVNQIYIWVNYYLNVFYTDIKSRKRILEYMEKLVSSMEENGLKIIPLINLSIFYALTKEKDGLLSAMQQLESAENLNEELKDDYYQYYIDANFAAIYYLSDCKEQAIFRLKKCINPPALMKATEKMYFKKRTQKWLDIMLSGISLSFEEFDTYLTAKELAETQWRLIGRGFLPSDIQFWSES